MKGALACLSISIGHKLGLFQQLAAQGPCSTAALAAAAGVTERWVREWCHQLAAARFISCDAQAANFWLSEGQRAVLVEAGPGEQARATPLEMVCMLPTVLGKSAQHVACFQSGSGLTFDEFGTEHMLHSHRHAKAVQFVKKLCELPGLQQKLTEGIKVADVGCGSGEILLHLAASFPASTFVGYDTSPQALGLAELRASEQGLQNLTLLNPSEGAESRLPCQPTYHLVVMQDSLHDMAHPQTILEAIRQSMLDDSSSSTSSSSRGPSQRQADALDGYSGGPLLFVSDKAACDDVASTLQMPAAALMLGYSVGLCLGSGLSEPGGAGLGTLGLTEAVARKLSAAAGFSRYRLLDNPSGDVNCYHVFCP
ncbi:hypothetical protein OEZ85_006506 [Tetradesmus obliquus]|uniref:Methyltransferase domain-containing protein n=1 Tax=Tetradesmus obliquus TaxID=3088 RepID=A0ABY8TYU6_TETOB|nr:hypothetical protein OEZ85_006506 [Tetradesmus obliquus]